jgi:hypothetical protein
MAHCPVTTPRPTCALFVGAQQRVNDPGEYYCYLFKGCTFVDVKISGWHGGAVYIQDRHSSLCYMLFCDFTRCESYMEQMDGRGGAAFIDNVRKIHVFRCTGVSCFALWGGFLQLVLHDHILREDLHVNESSSYLSSNEKEGAIITEIKYLSIGPAEIVQSVNFSHNTGASSSAIWVMNHFSIIMQFCHFVSNGEKNLMVVNPATSTENVYRCLDFVNNRYSDQSGCWFTYSCTLTNCLFVGNTWNGGGYFIGVKTDDIGRTLTFVQCIFGFDHLNFGGRPFTTVLCEARPDAEVSFDLVECWPQTPMATATRSIHATPLPTSTHTPIRTAPLCSRYECNTSDAFLCSEAIEISDTMYDGCTSYGNGGAISIMNDKVVFKLSNSEFVRCRAFARNSGGCIYFVGKFASIYEFRGLDCSAYEQAFCDLQIISSGTGTIELNESSGTDGGCLSTSFRTEFIDCSPGFTEVVHLLNFTSNYASDYATAIYLGNHHSLLMHYCRFSSNLGGTTLVVATGDLIDIFSCLEFISNDATQTISDSWIGLIGIGRSSRFQSCIFISNTFDFLISGSSTFSALFIRCIFDIADTIPGSGVSIHTESCILDSNEPISLHTDQCWPYDTFRSISIIFTSSKVLFDFSLLIHSECSPAPKHFSGSDQNSIRGLSERSFPS